MQPLSPFEVDAETIGRLSPSLFTVAINALLRFEVAHLGLGGCTLEIDQRPGGVSDGGIDAYIEAPSPSGRIPQGASAWQFKATDLTPSLCKQELARPSAQFLRDQIKVGAAYYLVLGHPLTSQQLRNRKNALLEEAERLDLPLTAENVEVIDANQLGIWVSDIPSLAVHQIFKRPGWNIIDYQQWSDLERYNDKWIDGVSRQDDLETLRQSIETRPTELRIHGVSGLGKTRLVLEALNRDYLRETVAYAFKADLTREMFNYLLTATRPLTLVVDECSAEEHEQLCKALPRERTMTLITIGDPSDYALESPVLQPSYLTDPELEQYLRTNHAAVREEAIGVLAGGAAGNVGFARWLAVKFSRDATAQQITDLIEQHNISRFVTSFLPPSGEAFLVAQTLALFERVGLEDALASQGDVIATFLEMTPSTLKRIVRDLERVSIVRAHGRYRQVEPHPLAAVLAATAWSEKADELIHELMPLLDADMFMSLLRRAADLGSYSATRDVFAQFLTQLELFGSLESIEVHDLGRYLIQLAIIVPDTTAEHLRRLIADADLDELRSQTQSRRGLVWALEKLAWHSRTFASAADTLLRLSLAENERYANNATGTWTALFGAGLPATSAPSAARLAYLAEKAANNDPEVRLLVINALEGGLSIHESVVRSAEIQGGAFVEPRGGETTYEARAEYHKAAIDLLSALVDDADAAVAEGAASALIRLVHPYLDDPVVSPGLFDALLRLSGSAEQELRLSLGHLRGLFVRVDDQRKLALIESLYARLPPLDPLATLETLLQSSPWELDAAERNAEVEAAFDAVENGGLMPQAVRWLSERELPGAWQLGFYLGTHTDDSTPTFVPPALLEGVERNPNALLGYLKARQETGVSEAFDSVIDSEDGLRLPVALRLGLTARGPGTQRAITRVLQLLPAVSASQGANSLFGWHRQLARADIFAVIDSLVGRISSDRDYDGALSWASVALYETQDLSSAEAGVIYRLVATRLSYPNLGTEKWAWARLAERVLPHHATDVVALILRLAETGSVVMLAQDEEPVVIREAGAQSPHATWALVGESLLKRTWQIVLALRPWVASCFELPVIEQWIDGSVDRAECVAAVADPGESVLTPIGLFLLSNFSESEQVTSDLAGAFMSGFWTGPTSSHYASQIATLESWASNRAYPEAVRDWAHKMALDVEKMRTRALRQEAEGEFGI